MNIRAARFLTVTENSKHLVQYFANSEDPNTIVTKSLTGNYMFKVNNRNTRTRSEICSKLTIKTPARPENISKPGSGRRSSVIVNYEHISNLVLVFLFLTLSW